MFGTDIMQMRKLLDIISEANDDDIDAEFNRELERTQQKVKSSGNELEDLQQQLNKLILSYRQAQKITARIKNDEVLMSILTEIEQLAIDNDIDVDSYNTVRSDIMEKARELESVVYGLDELFKDAIDNVKNRIEQIELDRDL